MIKKDAVILDNSNIVESYPGITLPLTASFVRNAYRGVFSGLLLRLTSSKKIVYSNSELLKSMVSCHKGRMYYQINNWYAIISYLPFSNYVISIWQEMLGVDNKSINIDANISPLIKLKVISNVLIKSGNTPREMKKLESYFLTADEYFHDNFTDNLSNEELKTIYLNLQDMVFNKWDITLVNDMYAFVYTHLAKKHRSNSTRCISAVANLESMKPVRKLAEITLLATSSNYIDELKKINNEASLKKFLEKDTPLSKALNDYIEIYGDRYLEELKLESPTYRTNPKLLINMILEYSNNIGAVKKILNNIDSTDPKSSRGFLKKAMTGIRNREISRLNRSRLYGMVRAIFLGIANNMSVDKNIDCVNDIFYLTVEEIFAFIDGKKMNLKQIIITRKNEYTVFRKLPAHNRVTLSATKAKYKKDEDIFIGKIIKGTPVSSGLITGEVVVIDNPGEASNISGKILVTKTTDPGWAFLLVGAKGIISEKGSLLSHTAIISRELRVPAVVGVNNATRIFKTGDHIRINGDNGQIEIL